METIEIADLDALGELMRIIKTQKQKTEESAALARVYALIAEIDNLALEGKIRNAFAELFAVWHSQVFRRGYAASLDQLIKLMESMRT